MKILHILFQPPTFPDGISINTRKLCIHLKKKGISSEYLTFYDPKKKPLIHILDGFKINYLPKRGFSFIKSMNILSFIELNKFFKKNHYKYDIFHVYSFTFLSSIYSLFFLKVLNKKTILTITGGVKRLVIDLDSFNFTFFQKLKKRLFRIRDKILGFLCINLCNFLTAKSKNDLQLVNKIFFCRRKSGTYWISNGIEIENKNLRKKYMRKYITFIGRLNYNKGLDKFLDIMEKVNEIYPSIPIMIVGKGELYSLIESKLNNLNIKYIPFIPHEKIYEIYLKSKLFILCSHSEGIPTVILEAMVYKTPILAPGISIDSTLIKDGYNGFLYNIKNIQEAVNKIVILLRNVSLREDFKNRSLKLINDKYSMEKISEKYISMYKTLYK